MTDRPPLPARPPTWHPEPPGPPNIPTPLREVRITDRRPEATPTRNFSGMYNADIIDAIVRIAREVDVDPATAVAIGLQETNLTGDNPLHYNMGDTFYTSMLETLGYASDKAIAQLTREERIRQALKHFKERSRRFANAPEAVQIQAYNGRGVLRTHGDQDLPLYGTGRTRIDTRKDPVYGHRVIALREHAIKPSLGSIVSVGGQRVRVDRTNPDGTLTGTVVR